MRDCSGRAGDHTWQCRSVRRGLARTAFILELSFLFVDHLSHRFFIERIVGILIDNGKNCRRASCHAIAAPIAFFGINGDEIASRTVTVSVIR